MVEIANDKKPDICTTNQHQFDQGYLRRSMSEQLANARLIAAAPDLLEALQAMTEAFLDTEGSHGSVESDAMDKAYDAIARATGDNP
jgi:hypothetical protein